MLVYSLLFQCFRDFISREFISFAHHAYSSIISTELGNFNEKGFMVSVWEESLLNWLIVLNIFPQGQSSMRRPGLLCCTLLPNATTSTRFPALCLMETIQRKIGRHSRHGGRLSQFLYCSIQDTVGLLEIGCVYSIEPITSESVSCNIYYTNRLSCLNSLQSLQYALLEGAVPCCTTPSCGNILHRTQNHRLPSGDSG